MNIKSSNSDVAGVLSVLAEAWWKTLSEPEQKAITRLWQAELTRQCGPVFEATEQMKSFIDDRVSQDVRIWLTARSVITNLDWARKRVSAADHDDTLFSRLQAWFRLQLLYAYQSMFDRGSDPLTQEFRKFMNSSFRL